MISVFRETSTTTSRVARNNLSYYYVVRNNILFTEPERDNTEPEYCL